MTNQSPFVKHREKVLGYYSTAGWLRGVVMALYSGSGHPVGLSQLTNTDAEHFAAFQEMVEHYRRVGENDPAFHALVSEIQQRQRDEMAAEERSQRLESWTAETRRQLRAAGKSPDAVDDNYSWFEMQFDLGQSPETAALAFGGETV